MDKQKAAADIIAHALPIVPFEGWNGHTLSQAAITAGYQATDVIRVFPGGAPDAVDAFIRQGDEKMLAALKNHSLETMKIRERITLCVRLRIHANADHREAVRKTVAFSALPFHLPRGLKNLYKTVDAIWYAAGDTSTDFNFYTKRLMLAGVYSSALLFWLDDKTPDSNATWEFLARRIENVMSIEKAKYNFKQWRKRKSA